MATDLRLPTDRIVRPDKDRFLDEENPFEAMMSRFDRAAELLDLEPGLYKVLRHPEKQITVSVPVMMDNGEVEVFTGHRVLYNTSRGPAKGGIRFDMQVTLEEVKALAARSRAAGFPVEAVSHALASALFGLLVWWMDGRPRASAEEASDLFRRMASASVRAALAGCNR